MLTVCCVTEMKRTWMLRSNGREIRFRKFTDLKSGCRCRERTSSDVGILDSVLVVERENGSGGGAAHESRWRGERGVGP